MSATSKKVHPELIMICPQLANGLDFKISKEGKIESNVSIDVIHTFLDKHCPDRKFIRTGKFKDDFAKAVKDQSEEVEIDEHQYFCEAMGLSYKAKAKSKKPKRIIVIPQIQSTINQLPADKVFPDVSTAAIIYIFMNDGLFSIQPSMFVHVRNDLKMLSLANPIRHYPTCVFLTPEGPKSSEDRRPIFHLIDNNLILQATDSPLNKIRKSESGVARAGNIENEETTASTVYVSNDGLLYSMKPAQFILLHDNLNNLSTCKSLKHNPTCIYLSDQILYSNDIKRPIYTIVDGKFIQTLELKTA